MSPLSLPPALWVADTSMLQVLCERLAKNASVAIDTESNSLHAYQERVCLIQLSDTQQDYLIDPLVGFDLSPLGVLLAEPGVEKVFHAAEYDVLCLHRDFGFTIKNIFDTMTAARVLGLPNLGLGALLGERFNLEIPKRFQKADWAQRPLPADMAQYAQTDTHYLLALKAQLEAELKEKDLLPLAREDFTRVEIALIPSNGHALHAAVRGQHDLTAVQRAVLEELCVYRDTLARKLDRPLFKVLSDGILLALAREQPHSQKEMQKIPDLSPRLLERHSSGLLKAVERGLKSKPISLPARPRLDDAHILRLEALKQWRKKEAASLGVLSDVVLPRDVLENIARVNPDSRKMLDNLMAEVPVRRKRFGHKILTVLKGL